MTAYRRNFSIAWITTTKQFAIVLVWFAGVSLMGLAYHESLWEMQLRVILAERHSLDAVVASGTGSGKTLPMALTMLLDNPAENQITITISPLKHLQVTQESDFNRRYGIRTVVINDDTKSENSWWDISCKFYHNSTLFNTSIIWYRKMFITSLPGRQGKHNTSLWLSSSYLRDPKDTFLASPC